MFRLDYLDEKALPKIVYELTKIEYVPFDRNMTKQKQHEVSPVLEKIEKYITFGCFFGFNIDLTRSQQA